MDSPDPRAPGQRFPDPVAELPDRGGLVLWAVPPSMATGSRSLRAAERGFACVVHGADFTFSGEDKDLD